MDEEEIKKVLWIAGLKNALKFNGIPNKRAIMGKLMAQMTELRSHVNKITTILDEILAKISNLSIEEQKTKLLKLDPNYPFAFFFKARINFLQENFDKGIYYLKKAISRDKKFIKIAKSTPEFKGLKQNEEFQTLFEQK